MKLFLLVILFLKICLSANAQVVNTSSSSVKNVEKSKTTILGHNLSPTHHLVPQGVTTVGFYAAAYGVTKQLTLGTSPWIFADYNMYNFIARYRIKKWKDSFLSGQTAYFKTYEEQIVFKPKYIMEAVSQNLTYTRKVSGGFLHYNINYMYFWDETKPFSLRREPLNDQPWQLTSTVLFESQVTKEVGLLGEAGVLGLNYHYPQVIMGASFYVKRQSWFFQFGYSITARPLALFNSDRVDNNELISSDDDVYYPSQDKELVDRDFSVHPEVQIQYSF